MLRKLHCFKCRKPVGVCDQGEPLPPIYCLACEPVVKREREDFARKATRT